MTERVRCPHCDVPLEFESHGNRFRFTAHTEEFCRDGTRQRVKDLERALADQREMFERAIAQFKQHIELTLEERAKQAERERSILAGYYRGWP